MKKFKLKSLKNRYGYILVPLITYIGTLLLAFYMSRIIVWAFGIPKNDISLPIDDKIPFVAEFIVIYILSYLQWIVCNLYISIQSKDACYRIISADAVGKLISFIIFVAFPTVMVRAEITGNGFFEFLTSVIYGADMPDNLFPSIHCFASWLCVRGMLKFTKAPKFLQGLNILMTILVFMSVVLVKQHVFVDIFGGIAVAEIGLFISEKFRLKRIFEKFEPKFVRQAALSQVKDKGVL